MAMNPLTLSLLGVELRHRRSRNEQLEGDATVPDTLQQVPELRPLRSSRRATSHYNHFQTVCSSTSDDPPSYAIATRHRPSQRQQSGLGREILPKYACTVAAEARVLLQLDV